VAVVGDRPDEAADHVSAPSTSATTGARAAVSPLTRWQAMRLLVLRNFIVYKSAWKLFLTGFLEPVFYLFSIGIGVGKLIEESFAFNGEQIPYAAFVAPAMLAASAFNGALLDSTYNVFFKLKYDKLYDQMLATPLTTRDIAISEIVWGQLRGGSYSAAFLGVMLAMGLVDSWMALLALPAALLIGFAFSAVFMALTTYMTSWQDFDKVTVVQLPLFLFSATFFPLEVLPTAGQWVVEVSPLYRGVVLCRELTTGAVSVDSLISVAYLLVMGVVGLLVVRRRLDTLLLT
jgi:lipooligosaccharide transport system permease protein